MARLQHTRDGRTLCQAHAKTGAPAYHTEGCDACAEARAKGIIRPNAASVPAKQRGRAKFRDRVHRWNNMHEEQRAALAGAVLARRPGAHAL